MKPEIFVCSNNYPFRHLSCQRLQYVETRIMEFYSQGAICEKIESKRDAGRTYFYTNMRLVFDSKEKPSVRLDIGKNMIQKFDIFGILNITTNSALPVLKYHDYIFQIYSKNPCKFKILYDVVINSDYEMVNFKLLTRLSNDIKDNTVNFMGFYTDSDLPPPYYEILTDV